MRRGEGGIGSRVRKVRVKSISGREEEGMSKGGRASVSDHKY